MSKERLARVYHKWEEWEEVRHNMWGDVDDRKKFLQMAISFTSNHTEYGKYMMLVVQQWKISCENALTDHALNKKAWVGHAACALAIGCPEDIVRQAWGALTDEQRFLANKEAERAIQTWENNYRKSRDIHKDMGGQVLLEWDS